MGTTTWIRVTGLRQGLWPFLSLSLPLLGIVLLVQPAGGEVITKQGT